MIKASTFRKLSIRGCKLRLQEGGKTAGSEQPLTKMPPPAVPTRPAASTSKPRSKNKRTPKEFVFMESQEPQNHSFRKASVVSVKSALMTRSAKRYLRMVEFLVFNARNASYDRIVHVRRRRLHAKNAGPQIQSCGIVLGN
jgi:hypothetical protein